MGKKCSISEGCEACKSIQSSCSSRPGGIFLNQVGMGIICPLLIGKGWGQRIFLSRCSFVPGQGQEKILVTFPKKHKKSGKGRSKTRKRHSKTAKDVLNRKRFSKTGNHRKKNCGFPVPSRVPDFDRKIVIVPSFDLSQILTGCPKPSRHMAKF